MNRLRLSRVFATFTLFFVFQVNQCCTSDVPLTRHLAEQVVSFSDFEYLGAFEPPKEAVKNPVDGGKWSTAYASGGIALRVVKNEKRFFATTHVYSGGLVYEMKYPGISKTKPYPKATIVREWGDIYKGRKKTQQEGKKLSGDVWTHGLYWDTKLQRLYWSYGHAYNVAQYNNPVLGYTKFQSTGSVPKGPWKSVKNGGHSQRIRGGVVRIPEWFARQYTNGKTLGIGFGGYWSGVATASQGPALYATSDPTKDGVGLQTQELLAFSHPDSGCGTITAQNVSRCKAIRNNDYFRSTQEPVSWDTDPINGTGYWTGSDTIEGAAVWIDTPTKHGLIFFPTLGQKKICYCSGVITADSLSSYWYIYDPNSLALVAKGEREPWQVNPQSTTKVTYPSGARVTGAVFDDRDQILYLYVYQAYQESLEYFPLVYAYKLKT